MKDLFGLMKQAQAMQQKMQDLQAELETVEVEGQSGGGLVIVRIAVKGEMRSLKIDPSLIRPEDAEILEDLIVAAHSDARAKAEAVMAEKMQGLTGGLGLPPGFKLPF